ncbi:MAG: fructosamine kinase family protein [Planctomycetota bacterium]
MNPELRAEVDSALGAAVVSASRVAGGDINEAWRAELDDGRTVFVKSRRDAPPDAFAREAEGLAWLAEADALRVPLALATGKRSLVLPFLVSAPPSADHDERLGRGLAALHRAGAPAFGFARDNHLARLPQDNRAAADWPTFYAERRLRPALRAARDRGLLGPEDARDLDAIAAGLADRGLPEEPPSRLHGDLWSGNAMCDERGEPVLVDPAVYGGFREMDLAMMALFGGFSERVLSAYDEAFPRAPGHEERQPLWQLWPLLAHLLMFGPGWAPAVRRALDRVR